MSARVIMPRAASIGSGVAVVSAPTMVGWARITSPAEKDTQGIAQVPPTTIRKEGKWKKARGDPPSEMASVTNATAPIKAIGPSGSGAAPVRTARAVLRRRLLLSVSTAIIPPDFTYDPI